LAVIRRKPAIMSPKISSKDPGVCVLVFKYDHGSETVSTPAPKSKGRKAKGNAVRSGRKG